MPNWEKKVALPVLVGGLALSLLAFVWAIGMASSEAQQGAMPNRMQGVTALGAGVGSGSVATSASTPTPNSVGQSEWTLIVDGFVQSPLNLSFDDLVAMPTTTVYAELYCVVMPTTPLAAGDWTGVRLGYVLDQAGVLPEAVKVAFYADDGFMTDLTVTTAMRDDILLAYERDDEPLTETVRLVVPCKWGYKWIRDPTHIELVDYDFLGTYESSGFSDEADIPGDIDCDGVADGDDNCQSVRNPDQTDADGDGVGDACDLCPDDSDCDDDTALDGADNCPTIANADQADADGDQVGDVCDNCPSDANTDQANTDESTIGVRGDTCDEDDDGDGYSDDDEATAGSLPRDAGSTPEACDGIDNDGNDGIDEGFPDANANGVPDCRDDAKDNGNCLFDSDGDTLCDGEDTNDDDNAAPADVFPDATENSCLTDKDIKCCSGGADNDPYDSTGPTPGVCDGWADIQDIMSYLAPPHSLNAGQYPWTDNEGYWARGDISGPTPAVPDGFVDIQDIMKYAGAPRALDGQCGVDY